MTVTGLNTSMRFNLLALQQSARLQDITQNRLATGLKVSSAIDNPSAYFTAQSLNSRAADLSALLDSIGQGIQTIKAATEAIETGITFLTQAKAVAEKALEQTAIPPKDWFASQEGVLAVVSSKAELLAAVSSGKTGDIVVYGHIEMDTQLNLGKGQNLVGVGYYGAADQEVNKFSSISFDFNKTTDAYGINITSATTISDISVKGTTGAERTNYLIRTSSVAFDVVMQNLDAYLYTPQNIAYGQEGHIGHRVIMGGKIEFKGTNNIYEVSPENIHTTSSAIAGANVTLNDNAVLNINSHKNGSRGFTGGTLTLNGNAVVNVAKSYFCIENTKVVINDDAKFNASDTYHMLWSAASLTLNDRAQLNSKTDDFGRANVGQSVSINSSNAVLNMRYGKMFNDLDGTWSYNAVAGVDLHINGKIYHSDDAVSTASSEDWLKPYTDTGQASPYPVADVSWLQTRDLNERVDKESDVKGLSAQYNSILSEYDKLISDADYRGVNILQGQNLKITFNESSSHFLNIKGVSISTTGLNLSKIDWNNATDVENALKEIESAIANLRNISGNMSNYYSILSTRDNFTNGLINILNEGADKLTLADINEESANMLTMGTRQQLAINALSLASQSAQAVLKLF